MKCNITCLKRDAGPSEIWKPSPKVRLLFKRIKITWLSLFCNSSLLMWVKQPHCQLFRAEGIWGELVTVKNLSVQQCPNMQHLYSNDFPVLGKAQKTAVPPKQVLGSTALISAVSNIVAMKQVRSCYQPCTTPAASHSLQLLVRSQRDCWDQPAWAVGPFPKLKIILQAHLASLKVQLEGVTCPTAAEGKCGSSVIRPHELTTLPLAEQNTK